MSSSRSDTRSVVITLGTLALLACTSSGAPSGAEGALTSPDQRAEILLDTRADGALLTGVLEPAPSRSDADRLLVLGAELEGRLAALDELRVLDARFVDGGAVVLGADRALRFYSARAEAITMDENVYGPLSIAGHLVAYVRGAPPDLELARADVRTGEVTGLTQSMGPVWSPALSSDGSEIVFVASAAGRPRLHRLDAAGVITPLAPTERTPSAPTAPRWSGSALVFEDEAGIVVLDLDRGIVVQELGGARALTTLRDGTLAASVGGRELAPLGIAGGAR